MSSEPSISQLRSNLDNALREIRVDHRYRHHHITIAIYSDADRTLPATPSTGQISLLCKAPGDNNFIAIPNGSFPASTERSLQVTGPINAVRVVLAGITGGGANNIVITVNSYKS